MKIERRSNIKGHELIRKILHGALAICVLAVLALGLGSSAFDEKSKVVALEIHKFLGIVVFVFALMSIMWRSTSSSGEVPAVKSGVLRYIAYTNHAILYGLAFMMPLLGWAMTSAFGKTATFFGLIILPKLVTKDLKLALILKEAHILGGYLTMTFIGLHIAAVFYHHLILKNNIIKRMF